MRNIYGFHKFALPFYSPDDLGGGGGGDDLGDPAGSDGDVATPSADPQPIELDENALIRIKGQDKPVKFGEYGRNFQSQWTKEAQRRAQLERELATERQQLQQLRQEQEAYKRNQQTNSQGDVYESLRQLPYLDGETAAKQIQGIMGQINQRDQILLATLNQMKQLQQVVNQLHQSHVGSSFESKIDKWFGENGWDPGFRDLAKEVYLAYEGEDLDVEFPRIFGERLSSIEKAFEARRQAASAKARQNRFVPGKGGIGSPSKPMELKGNEDPRDLVDKLWEQFQTSGT